MRGTGGGWSITAVSLGLDRRARSGAAGLRRGQAGLLHLRHVLLACQRAPQRPQRAPAGHEPQHRVAARPLHSRELQYLTTRVPGPDWGTLVSHAASRIRDAFRADQPRFSMQSASDTCSKPKLSLWSTHPLLLSLLLTQLCRTLPHAACLDGWRQWGYI